MNMPAKKTKQKSLNLLPQNKFEASLWGRILKWTLSTFRVIVIFVELVVIIGFLTRFWLDIEHSDLNDEIEQKQAVIVSYSKLEKDFKSTQDKLFLWEQENSPENHFSTLLNKIVANLPPLVQLTSLSNQDGIINIGISTTTEQPVAQFIANLKQYPEFATLAISQAKNDKGSAYIDVILTTTPIIPESNPESEGV